MGTVTYPDMLVAALLNENFIPVQVNIEEVSKLANEFQAIWTPNLNVLNHNQKRVYRVEGWLPPSEFVAMLGVAKKLSDPQLVTLLQNIAEAGASVDLTKSKDVGPFGLFSACSGPESKRGLGVLVELTKAMGDLKTSSLTSQVEQ